MTKPVDVSLYRSLFVHRSDVYAEQHSNGSYTPVEEPLDDLAIGEHLEGFASYGVYVIDPEPRLVQGGPPAVYRKGQTVHYVVFDLDTYNRDALEWLCPEVERLVAFSAAQNTAHLRCLLLEDSGGKGYHVWLILSEPVPAATVRAWTAPIAEAYRTAANAYVERDQGGEEAEPWPALEIFPKQDEVAPGGYGNLVKLPLGRHAKSGARSRWVTRRGWAEYESQVVPFPVGLIPEPAPKPPKPAASGGENGPAPFACVSKVLAEGAGTGIRDNALYHFCRYARNCGLPEDLTEAWADVVNEGFDPPLTPREVRTKVRSAYEATTPNPGCGAEWLRDYCPGGSRCFAPWNDRGGEDTTADDDPYPTSMTPEQRRAWRLGNAGNSH